MESKVRLVDLAGNERWAAYPSLFFVVVWVAKVQIDISFRLRANILVAARLCLGRRSLRSMLGSLWHGVAGGPVCFRMRWNTHVVHVGDIRVSVTDMPSGNLGDLLRARVVGGHGRSDTTLFWTF